MRFVKPPLISALRSTINTETVPQMSWCEIRSISGFIVIVIYAVTSRRLQESLDVQHTPFCGQVVSIWIGALMCTLVHMRCLHPVDLPVSVASSFNGLATDSFIYCVWELHNYTQYRNYKLSVQVWRLVTYLTQCLPIIFMTSAIFSNFIIIYREYLTGLS